VPGATLDELCERHKFDRVDFLKMNIEGADGWKRGSGAT
jgi:hypothetical protein